MKKNIELKILDDRVTGYLPEYATEAAAGLDLRAMLDEPLPLRPGDVATVSSGIAIHIHDAHLAGVIVPRSGLGVQGLVLGNLVGVIDADYQGPLNIALWNRTDNRIVVAPMQRVAQLLLIPIARAAWQLVSSFSDATMRGENGFGSTGEH